MSNDEVLQVQDLKDGKLDITTIAEVAMVGTTADTTTNREGVEIDTLQGRLNKLGFEPPLAYASGITFTGFGDSAKTIDSDGIVYGVLGSSRPFTTTGNFQNDLINFFVVQDRSEIGDVRTTQSNTYDSGTSQNFDAATASTLSVNGVDVTTKNNSQDSAIANAASLANTANNTANNANSTANTANNTANAALAEANSKISQAQGDARYLRTTSSKRQFVNFQILSNGNSVGKPSGWVTSEQDNGRYRVAHNTGQDLYPVVTVVNDANNSPQKTASIVYVNNNAFDITIEDTPTNKLLNVMVAY